MWNQYLQIISKVLFATAAALFFATFSLSFFKNQEQQEFFENKKEVFLPKNSFSLSEKAYQDIGEPFLSLNFVAPKMQLPDLRQKIIYYGQNGRPDGKEDNTLLYFSIGGSKETASIQPGKKLFLHYLPLDGGKYEFSPGNIETSLWIEACHQGNEAEILIGMLDENARPVEEPRQNFRFNLQEKEMARVSPSGWEIDKWKVDGTLLARQKARWMGVDKFLERHGGQEFENIASKNRIDFGEKEDVYSVYVENGDCLIWKDGKWHNINGLKEDTKRYPLMVIKKVEERLMGLELWDVEGKRKMALNLLKSMETWVPSNIQEQFKFIGARTKSQFVFEVDDEKMLLSPQDWLVLTENGWIKLTTAQEIDDFVSRKVIGTLFVFNGIERKDDQQVMKGILYNPGRTISQDIELMVQKDGLVYHSTDKERSRSYLEKYEKPIRS